MFAGSEKRGKLVEWVEKASFDRLNRLFEIVVSERSCQTLLTARNLRVVVQVSQPYVTNILPRRLPKKTVSGEHFVLKDLSFYTEAREADAQARQDRLSQREEKRQEETLRRALGEKCLAALAVAKPLAEKKRRVPSKGILLRSHVSFDSSDVASESSSSRRLPGQFGSGPSVLVSKRVVKVVEEEATVDQPGSPRVHPGNALPVVPNRSNSPNGDSPCPEPEVAAMVDTMGGDLIVSDSPPHGPDSLAIVLPEAPVARMSFAPHALRAGFGERHQRRLCEAIELSESTAPCERPKVVESPAGNKNSAVPILLSDHESSDRDVSEDEDGLVCPTEEPTKEASVREDSDDAPEDIFACLPTQLCGDGRNAEVDPS